MSNRYSPRTVLVNMPFRKLQSFLCLSFKSGVFLGLLSGKSLLVRQWRMLWLNIVVSWFWRSARIFFEISLVHSLPFKLSFCLIWGQFFSSSFVLGDGLQSHGPQIMVTGTLSSLEMFYHAWLSPSSFPPLTILCFSFCDPCSLCCTKCSREYFSPSR